MKRVLGSILIGTALLAGGGCDDDLEIIISPGFGGFGGFGGGFGEVVIVEDYFFDPFFFDPFFF